MTELNLPPHGREPSFAADETAYDVVVRKAIGRRRGRAVAGTSATAALSLLAVAALSAPGGGSSSIGPADTVPVATTGLTAEPSKQPLPGTLPTALPTMPPMPTGLPLPSSEPSATASPRERPRPSHAPGATPRWTESSAYVDDRPAEACVLRDPVAGWCFRYLGPASVASGAPETFTTELCRLATARTPGRIDFDLDPAHEMSVWISGPNDGPNDKRQHAFSILGYRDGAHSRTVDPGQCLRWADEWNGLDVDGRPLPAGTYDLLLSLPGSTRDDSPTSSSDQERMWMWGTEEFRVT